MNWRLPVGTHALALLAITFFALVALGCTSTVTTTGGEEITGKILGGSESQVFIEPDDETGTRAVNRAEIEDVHHPAAVATLAMGIGFGAALIGTIAAAASVGEDCEMVVECSTDVAADALTIAGLGTLTATFAIATIATSIAWGVADGRYESTTDSLNSVSIAPWVGPEAGGLRGGLAVGVSF